MDALRRERSGGLSLGGSRLLLIFHFFRLCAHQLLSGNGLKYLKQVLGT